MTDLSTLRAQRDTAQTKLNVRAGQSGYASNALTIKAYIETLDEQIAELEAVEAAEGDTDGGQPNP